MLTGYFKIGNTPCHIVSDTFFFFFMFHIVSDTLPSTSKIYVPAVSMACPYHIHPLSGHQKQNASFDATIQNTFILYAIFSDFSAQINIMNQ